MPEEYVKAFRKKKFGDGFPQTIPEGETVPLKERLTTGVLQQKPLARTLDTPFRPHSIHEEIRRHLVTEKTRQPIKMVLKGQYKVAYEMLRDADEAQVTPALIGPVGCGKTLLARYYAEKSNRPFYMLTLTEYTRPHHIIGSFDPTIVLRKGYCLEAFTAGPLVLAMVRGGIFIANEINRAAEHVQNDFLQPLEEKSIYIPYIGEIVADERFFFIAAMNPEEFAGTHRLSEALRDRLRFWIDLDYPSRPLEIEIIKENTPWKVGEDILEKIRDILEVARDHPAVSKPPSIRAGIAIARMFATRDKGGKINDAYNELRTIAKSVLRGSIKVKAGQNINEVIKTILDEAFGVTSK